MSAAYETIVVHDVPPARLRELAGLVAADLVEHHRWKLVKEFAWCVVLRVGWNWRSWGETVRLQVEEKSIRIDSECNLQLVDWGKNRINVNLARVALLRQMDKQPAA